MHNAIWLTRNLDRLDFKVTMFVNANVSKIVHHRVTLTKTDWCLHVCDLSKSAISNDPSNTLDTRRPTRSRRQTCTRKSGTINLHENRACPICYQSSLCRPSRKIRYEIACRTPQETDTGFLLLGANLLYVCHGHKAIFTETGPPPSIEEDQPRTMLCTARTMLSQEVRPSVCLFVTRRYSVETAKHITGLFRHRVIILIILILRQCLWYTVIMAEPLREFTRFIWWM